MTVQYFDSLDDDSTDDLPWIKEYVKMGGDVTIPRNVLSCYIGSKGILILTAKWKGFVRKGTGTYKHLSAALPEYLLVKTGLYVLVASGTSDGKCRVGIDQSSDMMHWIKDGDGYHQKSNGGDGIDGSNPTENPLLVFPVHPPVTTITRTGESARGRATKSSQ